MNKIRIKFMRGNEVKYISHLDMVKVFERAIRRTRLPIAYSQGFNPHPQMVFGLPLPVGVTSSCEFADLEFTDKIDPADFIAIINRELPDGLKVVDAKIMAGKLNIMKSISMASYEILVSAKHGKDIARLDAAVSCFMAQDKILAKKETKSGSRDIDIRPMVHKIEAGESRQHDLAGWDSDDGNFIIFAVVDAGGVSNLKPELLVEALDKTAGLSLEIEGIHRTGLFVRMKGRILDPMDPDVLMER